MGLPEEIVEDILSRVEVESLLKFRCVSKSWRCLIDSQQFKKTHLEFSRKKPVYSEHRVILSFIGLFQCRLQWLLNGAAMCRLDQIYEPCLFGDYAVGSFNGLVCLVKDAKHFTMWNPSTRIIHRLQEISSTVAADDTMHVTRCGMSWFESSGEYKIFAVVSSGRYFEGRVYSSKTNSWKIVGLEGSNLRVVSKKVGQFVSVKLHWGMEHGRSNVVSFDFKSEKLGLVELPFKENYGLSLGVLGGCLCALNPIRGWRWCFDVWIMKEYGVKESWQKLEPPFPDSAPLFVRENGEFVMFFGNSLLVYSHGKNVFYCPGRNLVNLLNLACTELVMLCTDTLVSPNIVSSN